MTVEGSGTNIAWLNILEITRNLAFAIIIVLHNNKAWELNEENKASSIFSWQNCARGPWIPGRATSLHLNYRKPTSDKKLVDPSTTLDLVCMGFRTTMQKPARLEALSPLKCTINFKTCGMPTCSCSIKVQFFREVLEVRELLMHNIHNVSEESLFSVCRSSVFQLAITNC